MIQISKVLNRPESGMFFSFIVGLGLIVLILHRPIQTQLELSMAVSEVEGRVIKTDGKCFRYHAEDVPCEKSNPK